MHEVLVNRLGGLSLPRKSVVRLTDRPDMTLDVYRGRKTIIQPIIQQNNGAPVAQWVKPWPTDLVVPSLTRLEANLLNCKRGSIAHSLPLSSTHRPDMTEILLKRT